MQCYAKLGSLLMRELYIIKYRRNNIHLSCNFDNHLNYASIVWGQTKSSINRVFTTQKKAIRTIHFKGKFDHTSSLFCESNIVTLADKISIKNCLFVSKSLNNQLSEIFNNWFVFSSDAHIYETSCSKMVCLK